VRPYTGSMSLLIPLARYLKKSSIVSIYATAGADPLTWPVLDVSRSLGLQIFTMVRSFFLAERICFDFRHFCLCKLSHEISIFIGDVRAYTLPSCLELAGTK